jgi:hypothetical protein
VVGHGEAWVRQQPVGGVARELGTQGKATGLWQRGVEVVAPGLCLDRVPVTDSAWEGLGVSRTEVW